MSVKKLAAGLLAFSFWLGCRAEPLDVSGHWGGTAELTVDGEPKVVNLQWELDQSESALRGTIAWDDLRREVTGARIEPPEIHLESATPDDTIAFAGLFRSGEIQGRFSIRYSVDPEPYSGRFHVQRVP